PAKRLRNRALRTGRTWLPDLRWPPHPGTNYFDYAQGLRRGGPFRDAIESFLRDWRARGAEAEEIYTKTYATRRPAEALVMLASLEINLQGFERMAACGNLYERPQHTPPPEAPKTAQTESSGAQGRSAA